MTDESYNFKEATVKIEEHSVTVHLKSTLEETGNRSVYGPPYSVAIAVSEESNIKILGIQFRDMNGRTVVTKNDLGIYILASKNIVIYRASLLNIKHAMHWCIIKYESGDQIKYAKVEIVPEPFKRSSCCLIFNL